jgi:hypothetical protein
MTAILEILAALIASAAIALIPAGIAEMLHLTVRPRAELVADDLNLN